MKEKKRYDDTELSLLKNTFAENEDLLRAIRKVFLQMPLDGIDTTNLDKIKDNPEVLRLIRKTYLPTLDADAPNGQIIDLWMTVDTKDKSPQEAYHQLVSREKLLTYLDEQLRRIETGDYDISGLKFTDLEFRGEKSPTEAFEDQLTRNYLISHNEGMIRQIYLLAGQKDETVEQTQKRLAKDSSK